jgi:hypothetical protein
VTGPLANFLAVIVVVMLAIGAGCVLCVVLDLRSERKAGIHTSRSVELQPSRYQRALSIHRDERLAEAMIDEIRRETIRKLRAGPPR